MFTSNICGIMENYLPFMFNQGPQFYKNNVFSGHFYTIFDNLKKIKIKKIQNSSLFPHF